MLNIESARSVVARGGLAIASIGSGVNVDVEFVSATGNFNAMWLASDPTKLWIPRTGIYSVYFNTVSGINADAPCTQVSAAIRQNGAGFPLAWNSINDPSATLNEYPNVSGLIEVNKGDFITCTVSQQSGSAVSLGINAWCLLSLIRPYYPETGDLEVG